MLLDGFDDARLVEFGHPYLSSLKSDLQAVDVASLKAGLQIHAEDKVALFVSEPVREHYGNAHGYDQYQVLEYFLTCIAAETDRPEVVVKLHPKDNRASFQVLAEKFKALSPRFIGSELSPIECLALSDYVFGMRSIMLIEAYVLGKKVASLQPGLCVEDHMVLSRHKLIPAILRDEKRNLLKLDWATRNQFNVEFAPEKFLGFVERTLRVHSC